MLELLKAPKAAAIRRPRPRGGAKKLGAARRFFESPSRRMPTPGQRGVSLVELLVGMALGLFIVAHGVSLLTAHLRENRALLLESRLMQDLRVASDLVTRDLRRAGHWGAASAGMWQAAASGVVANPYTALAPAAAASDAVTFRFSRDAIENHQVDSNEQFGFRLKNGALDMLLGSGNWQSLTDVSTLVVTAFSVTPTVQDVSLARFCPGPCPIGSSQCPPHQQVRSLRVQLTGKATSDASVVRTLGSQVRLRADAVSGSCVA